MTISELMSELSNLITREPVFTVTEANKNSKLKKLKRAQETIRGWGQYFVAVRDIEATEICIIIDEVLQETIDKEVKELIKKMDDIFE